MRVTWPESIPQPVPPLDRNDSTSTPSSPPVGRWLDLDARLGAAGIVSVSSRARRRADNRPRGATVARPIVVRRPAVSRSNPFQPLPPDVQQPIAGHFEAARRTSTLNIVQPLPPQNEPASTTNTIQPLPPFAR